MRHNLLLLLLLCGAIQLTAQPQKNQRFAAFVYGGPNFSQIDGDYYFGYNKPGFRFGVGANVLWTPKLFGSIGLGFSQGGSRPSRSEKYNRGGATIDIRLNNIEIPVMMHYRLGKKHQYTRKEDYKLYRSSEIQFGLIASRNTSVRVNRVGSSSLLPIKENFVSVQDQFREFDLYWVLGVTVQFSATSSIYLQHGKSILGIYQPEEFRLEDVLPLYPYYLNLGYRYVLY